MRTVDVTVLVGPAAPDGLIVIVVVTCVSRHVQTCPMAVLYLESTLSHPCGTLLGVVGLLVVLVVVVGGFVVVVVVLGVFVVVVVVLGGFVVVVVVVVVVGALFSTSALFCGLISVVTVTVTVSSVISIVSRV